MSPIGPNCLLNKSIQVGELIAQGGCGRVYRAYDLSIGRALAVKVPHTFLLSDEKAIRRFVQEAQLSTKLNHSNIARIYSLNSDHDEYYLAMEFIDGISLADHIHSRGAISWNQSIFLCQQILDALQHFHDNGIIHRDIKPDNILLCGEELEQIKIIDFGLARLREPIQRLTETGFVVGTPGYMSPEQMMGAPLDARTDIYSVGCILFECLTGVTPFFGNSPEDTLKGHLANPVPDIPGIPDSLQCAVVTAMAKQPAHRFASAKDFAAALKQVVADPEVVSGALKRVRKLAVVPFAMHHHPPTNNRMLTAMIVIVLIAGILSLLQYRTQTVTEQSSTGSAVTSPRSEISEDAVKADAAGNEFMSDRLWNQAIANKNSNAKMLLSATEKLAENRFRKEDYKGAVRMYGYLMDHRLPDDPQLIVDIEQVGRCDAAMHIWKNGIHQFEEAARLRTQSAADNNKGTRLDLAQNLNAITRDYISEIFCCTNSGQCDDVFPIALRLLKSWQQLDPENISRRIECLRELNLAVQYTTLHPQNRQQHFDMSAELLHATDKALADAQSSSNIKARIALCEVAANIYQGSKLNAEATHTLENAIELLPRLSAQPRNCLSFTLRSVHAGALYLNDDLPACRAATEMLLREQPVDKNCAAMLLLLLARVQQRYGEWRASLSTLQRTLEQSESADNYFKASIYYSKAIAFAHSGQYDAAEQAMKTTATCIAHSPKPFAAIFHQRIAPDGADVCSREFVYALSRDAARDMDLDPRSFHVQSFDPDVLLPMPEPK